MGWLISGAGREGNWTCVHGSNLNNGPCKQCTAIREEEEEKERARQKEINAARVEKVFGDTIPLSEASQVSEVEDYLDYEAGLMEWVTRDEFVRRTQGRAVFASGSVWTYINGNAMDWR